MIDITNDNVKEYVMLNGGNKLFNSITKGVHVLILNKKNKLLAKSFSKAIRTPDKLAVRTTDTLEFIFINSGTINKVLMLTADGEFSIEVEAFESFCWHGQKSFTLFMHNLKMDKNATAIIPEIQLTFKG